MDRSARSDASMSEAMSEEWKIDNERKRNQNENDNEKR